MMIDFNDILIYKKQVIIEDFTNFKLYLKEIILNKKTLSNKIVKIYNFILDFFHKI